MIPEVEKDLENIFSMIDEISKIDFWDNNSENHADKLIKKARKIENNIKQKYKGHFDEKEIESKTPEDLKDYLDSKK